MAMYKNDKTRRFTVRMSDAQAEFVCGTSQIMGISPSDFIRMIVNTMMYSAKVADRATEYAVKSLEGELRRENEQADCRDKL